MPIPPDLSPEAGPHQFRALFESALDAMVIAGDDGRYVDANAAASVLFGLPREALLGKSIVDFATPGFDFPRAWEAFRAAGQERGEFALRRPDGSVRFAEYSATANFVPGRHLSILRDITERRLAETALREAAESMATAQRLGHFGSWEMGLTRDLELIEPPQWSDECYRIFGLEPGKVQITTEVLRGLIHPDDRESALSAFLKTLAERKEYSQAFRILRPDGTLRYVHDQSRVILDELTGQPVKVVGIVHDITERQRAEEALRESEARYRALFSAMQEGLALHEIICDEAGRPRDYRFLEVNAAFERLTGLSRERVVGRTALEVLPNLEPGWIEAYGRVALTGEPARFQNYSAELGRHFEVMAYQSQPGQFATIFTDITARKQHEREREAIITVSAALRAAGTRAEMLPVILDQTRALLDVEEAALVRLEPPAEETVVALARGLWEEMVGQRLPAGAGISAHVIATGRPYRSNAIAHDPLVSRLGLAGSVVAAAAVPLIVQGQAWGTLNVGSRHPLDDNQLRLLEAIGDIAANALQRATLHEQTRRRADEFAALFATARELAAQPDLPWLLETIVNRALDLIPASGAFIALCETTHADDLEIAEVRGLPIPVGARLQLGEGAAGHVARTWQPLILEDYHTWEGRSPQFDDTPFSALLSVPMLSGGTLVGVLQIGDIGPTGRRFTAADADLLAPLASHAASAIQNARALEEARLWADQLGLLYDAGLALNSVLEPATQLEYLLKIAGQAVHADVIEFFRFDAATGRLSFEVNLGHTEEARASLSGLGHKLVDEPSLAAAAARTRLPLSVPDLYADPRYIMVAPELRSGLWVPVEHHGQLRGVLGVLSRKLRAFAEKDERLLLLFATQTAVAIQNAHLFAETERRLRHLQALRRIDAAITSTFDLHVVLGVLLDQVVAQLHVDAASVLLLNPVLQTLEHAASRGFHARHIERTRLRLGDGPTGRAALEFRSLKVPDLSAPAAELPRDDLLAWEQFQAYYAVPLISKGRLQGMLEAFHRTPLDADAEWLDFFETLAGQAAVAVDNVGLFDELQRSNAELMSAYNATIAGWSRALDLRDKETEGHSQRVTDMTLDLARAIGLGDAELVHIRRGALLHDIGKLGVPDAILHKPGPLTAEEWAVMKRHPDLAHEMLSPIAFLRPALDIPYCHHEKWDGTGYPRGIKGEQIPLAARLFALADVWDALRSDRPYRPGWPPEQVLAHIRAEAGRHFDPRVVEVFLNLLTAAPP